MHEKNGGDMPRKKEKRKERRRRISLGHSEPPRNSSVNGEKTAQYCI
jgi:hypothetical protein